MTAGTGIQQLRPNVSPHNWRHQHVLKLLNMNAIPNNIPRNMVNSYMWALEYGTLNHQLPKNLAKKLMYYRTPHMIYHRAQQIKQAKNTHPNLSYNDVYALSHVAPYVPRTIEPGKIINSYKSLRRRGMSHENAAMAIVYDPIIGMKHNAVNKIKRAWKTFRYSTMLPSQKTPSNPKFRAKIERYEKSANRSFNKYSRNLSRALGGGSPRRRTRMSALMTELLRKKMRVN